jgi:hypothetical protein
LDSKKNELLDQALKLALEEQELGYLQELAFLSDIELQAAIDKMESLPAS